LKERQIYK